MTYKFFAEREEPAFKHIKANAVSGAIGADIDLDITRPLSAEEAAEVRHALNHYHVIFFHGQDLTPAQHVEFAQTFGEVQMGGTIPRLDEQPEVKKQEYTKQASVSGDVNMHADDTFKEIPSKASILHGVDMPPAGGDTIWVNTEAAYAALSEPMKEMLGGLTAEHNLAEKFGYIVPGQVDYSSRQKIAEHYPPVNHPVIRTHPETGNKSIFINEMVVTKINELSPDESDAMLALLIAHLKNPLFQCRLRWKNGDVVVWDNRSTQHLILPDFQPQYRLNHRIAICDTARPV